MLSCLGLPRADEQFDAVDGVSPVSLPTESHLLSMLNEHFLCGRRQVIHPACIVSLSRHDKPVR